MADKLPAQMLFFVIFFVCGLVLLIYASVNMGIGVNAHVTNYTTTYDNTKTGCIYTTCPIYTFNYQKKSYTSCSDESECICNTLKNISVVETQKAYPLGYKEEFRIRKNDPDDCSDLENELALFIISTVFICGSFVYGYMIYQNRKKIIAQNDQLELVKHRDSFSGESV